MRPAFLTAFCILSACSAVPLEQGSASFASASMAQAKEANLDVQGVWSRVSQVAADMCRDQRAASADCLFSLEIDETSDMGVNARSWVGEDGVQMVGVSRKLLDLLRSEDELAFVMGHEMGHSVANHHSVFGQRNLTGGFSVSKQGSQRIELEADAIGTLISSKAGFNPLSGVSLLNRLTARTERRVNSHPERDQRISVIKRTFSAIQSGAEITLN